LVARSVTHQVERQADDAEHPEEMECLVQVQREGRGSVVHVHRKERESLANPNRVDLAIHGPDPANEAHCYARLGDAAQVHRQAPEVR
jgi:hypothetical protein